MDCVTLTSEPKTDRRVLPQPAALEPAVADKPKGLVRNGRRDTAADNAGRVKARSRGQQARGETSAAVAADASPAQAESGVSRTFATQNCVFVLGRSGQPLMPCHPTRARRLLAAGRARVHRLHPFTIRLTDRNSGVVQPILIKFDPGSKVTGIAIVRQDENNHVRQDNSGPQHVLHLAELTHRGAVIRKHMTQRAMFRRRRRTANLRYRAPRFNNRTRQKGWLPPSLMSRVDNTLSWIDRFRRVIPVTGFVQELVRFDMQAMGNPDIQGVEYQQGTLAGYELREYLLEKWGRKCAYCGAENIPLQVEHIHPKARGGGNRVSNLTMACRCCNESKGAQPVEAFLAKKPALLKNILAQAKRPLSDAAAVNATRWELWRRLAATGLPVRTGSGGRTKWNRSRLGIPKSHCLDAVCAGPVGDKVTGWDRQPLAIKATGRGSYQRTRLDSFGFPRGFLMRQKLVRGFQTGDMVRAVVPKGKRAGTHTGRVAVRANGNFNIQTATGTVTDISNRHCRLLMRADGYSYHHQKKEGGVPPGPKDAGFPRRKF